MEKKLAIIYWPKGGSVEHVANKIKNVIEGFDVTFICVEDVYVSDLKHFDAFIFGGSTVGADHWSNKESDNKWAPFFTELETLKLNGKTAAVFGLGNQVLYPDHFVDGMMFMKRKLLLTGVSIVGETSTEGYDYNESLAEVDGKFVGLALDEDAQPELTDQRISAWLENVLPKF